MITALIAVAVGSIYLVGWSVCRMAALQDRADAQRNLLALLAEQADDVERAEDREISDNLGI